MGEFIHINRVLILGGGSAGYLTAITLKKKLPELAVTVVRSKEMGVIGVGESTTIPLPEHLHEYLGLPRSDFYAQAEPVWKLGIRFLWGPRKFFDYAFDFCLDTQYAALKKSTGYYCEDVDWDYVGIPSGLMSHNMAFLREPNGRPVIGQGHAYHLYNPTFVDYLEKLAERLGVVSQDDVVTEVLQDDRGITGLRLQSGSVATADLFIDCSGFRALLVGKTFNEPYVSYKSTLFCSRAVITEWPRTDEPIQPYTTCETMECGWCWRIDHENFISRGYVYCPEFISDSDAEAEFRRKNPKVEKTRIVKFVSGRYERAWVKNVVAIGNSAGFVEPLESTALGAICALNQALAETIKEAQRMVGPQMVRQFNKRHAKSWDAIRQFLGLHYRYNKRIDNPFWRECWEKSDIGSAEEIVAYYREMGPSVLYRGGLLDPHDQFGMEGYLSLLVGQKVPYEPRYRPDPAEFPTWDHIRSVIRHKVTTQAYTVPEALHFIRHPDWQWPEITYRLKQPIRKD